MACHELRMSSPVSRGLRCMGCALDPAQWLACRRPTGRALGRRSSCPLGPIALLGLAGVATVLLSGCASPVAGVQGMGLLLTGAHNAMQMPPESRPRANIRAIVEPSSLTDDERARLARIPAHEADPGQTFPAATEIHGYSCLRAMLNQPSPGYWTPTLSEQYGHTPLEAAITQLRIGALRRGASAVILSNCALNPVYDIRTDCHETWVCTGMAVEVERSSHR